MIEISKSRRYLRLLASLLIVLALAKLVWVAVETIFLPATGVDEPSHSLSARGLYGRYRLASDEELPRRIIAPKAKSQATLRGWKLLATYLEPRRHLAVLSKGSQSRVVEEGDSLLGYRVIEIAAKQIRLEKDGKEYSLAIPEDSYSKRAFIRSDHSPGRERAAHRSDHGDNAIVQEGDRRLVPRSLLLSYRGKLDRIFQEISIAPYRVGTKLEGFEVRSIRKGSIMEKLGLRRGDIITAIDGEPIRDYRKAMELFRELDSLENLTLGIRRGGQEMELEYEVR